MFGGQRLSLAVNIVNCNEVLATSLGFFGARGIVPPSACPCVPSERNRSLQTNYLQQVEHFYIC